MSTKDNQQQSPAPRSQQFSGPDGKSELPVVLPEFPPPDSDPSGGSGSSTGK